MKIKVGDATYPFVHPAQARSSHLMALHNQSGITFEIINDGLTRFNELQKQGLAPEVLLATTLSDMEILKAIAGLVYLAMREAGTTVDFADAADVPFMDVQFIAEPGDVVVQDPEEPALPASGQGGNRAARRTGIRSPSTRSKPPSPVD